MKDMKKKVEFFTFYDKTGIEKHLEQMASVGWLLEKMPAFRWIYRRIEPKKIHFSVSYYATVTDFEPEPTEQQQAFKFIYSGKELDLTRREYDLLYYLIVNRSLTFSREQLLKANFDCSVNL